MSEELQKALSSRRHIFQRNIGLSIKTTFHVPKGSVKFATQFKESLCSLVVTFQSFGLEGHGVQPLQDEVYLFRIVLYSTYVFSFNS